MTLRVNPDLDEQELYAFAVDIEHWTMLDQIINHPHTWPELTSWAQRMLDDPSQATPPPEPAETQRRGLFHRQHPPLIDIPDVDQPTEARNEPLASEIYEISPDSEPDDTIDTTHDEELSEADGENLPDELAIALLPRDDDAYGEQSKQQSSFLRLPVLLVATGMLIVVMVLAGGMTMMHVHATARSHDEAMARCTATVDTVRVAIRERDSILDKAQALVDSTKQETLNDPTILTDLTTLIDKDVDASIASCTTDLDTVALDQHATSNKQTANLLSKHSSKLKQLMEQVTASQLDKTIEAARALLNTSHDRVTDESTRTTLEKAIAARDSKAIAKAMQAVNDSIAAKNKADKEAEAQRQAEEERLRAEQAQQQAESSQQQSYTPSYTPQRYTPSTTPQQTTPTPQATTPQPQQTVPTTPQQTTPSTPKTDPGNDGSVL